MPTTRDKLSLRRLLARPFRRMWPARRCADSTGPGVTRLSARDTEILNRLLDDPDPKPNDALRAAAERYKQVIE